MPRVTRKRSKIGRSGKTGKVSKVSKVSKVGKGEGRSVSTSTLHHRETARFRRLNELLAKRVRRMRLERAMTIEQASEAAGVEPMTWYRVEHRRSNPTLAVLGSIAAVFGLTVSALLDEG